MAGAAGLFKHLAAVSGIGPGEGSLAQERLVFLERGSLLRRQGIDRPPDLHETAADNTPQETRHVGGHIAPRHGPALDSGRQLAAVTGPGRQGMDRLELVSRAQLRIVFQQRLAKLCVIEGRHGANRLTAKRLIMEQPKQAGPQLGALATGQPAKSLDAIINGGAGISEGAEHLLHNPVTAKALLELPGDGGGLTPGGLELDKYRGPALGSLGLVAPVKPIPHTKQEILATVATPADGPNKLLKAPRRCQPAGDIPGQQRNL